jgi:hypothetical protein
VAEPVEPEPLYPLALLVELDDPFNLLPGLLVQLLHPNIGGRGNPRLDRSRVQVIADEHISDPWRLTLVPTAGKNPIRVLPIFRFTTHASR